MGFAFAPGVSACIADGQLVLLNLRAGRYAMLQTELASVLMRLIRCEASQANDARLQDRLCDLGVLVHTSHSCPPEVCMQGLPTESFLERSWVRPSRGALLLSMARLLQAKATLRSAGLGRTLDGLSSVTPAIARKVDAVVATASKFAELRLVVRPLDRCLPLSIALARVAKRHDANVRLVLGVACNPFAAHAWVQQDNLVLNDRVDSVASFTPILTI